MLCRVQDVMSNAAVEERYQPQIGGLKKLKKPLGMARRSLSLW